jgi:hypothetical protein
MTYEIPCTPSQCAEIRIVIETQPSSTALARGLVSKIRRTEIAIPTSFLANKSDLRFDCVTTTNKRLITSVDYGSQKTICSNYNLASTCETSSGSVPATSFGGTAAGCSTVTNNNCANNKGIRTVGLFAGQSACNL